MPRKKPAQKQKQKQKVTQKQQVSQNVVVQVDTRRRRATSTKRRRPKQQAVEQPTWVHPSLLTAPAPVQPAFMEASALETNRRLQLFGDDLEVLKAQEASRANQAVRPTANTGEVATSMQPPKQVEQQMFHHSAPMESPIRHSKAEGSNAPLNQEPTYAVDLKGKQKEIVKNIRENQQAYLDKFAEIQNRVGQQKKIVDKIREAEMNIPPQSYLDILPSVLDNDLARIDREVSNYVPRTMSAESMRQGLDKIRLMRQQGLIPQIPEDEKIDL